MSISRLSSTCERCPSVWVMNMLTLLASVRMAIPGLVVEVDTCVAWSVCRVDVLVVCVPVVGDDVASTKGMISALCRLFSWF